MSSSGALRHGLHLLEFLQQPGQREASCKRGEARALDRGAVGHRIAEWHADLDDVGRCGDRAQGRA